MCRRRRIAGFDAAAAPVSWQKGNHLCMTSLRRQTSRTRRAACIGLLVAVPLLPVTACGDSGGGGGDSEVEDVQTDDDEDDDGGLY